MSSDAQFDGYNTPSPSDVQLDTHSAPPSVTHSDSYTVPPPIVVRPDAYGASTPSIIQPADAFGTQSVHIVSRMPCELEVVRMDCGNGICKVVSTPAPPHYVVTPPIVVQTDAYSAPPVHVVPQIPCEMFAHGVLTVVLLKPKCSSMTKVE